MTEWMNESINQQSVPRTAHPPLKMIYSCFNALGQNWWSIFRQMEVLALSKTSPIKLYDIHIKFSPSFINFEAKEEENDMWNWVSHRC